MAQETNLAAYAPGPPVTGPVFHYTSSVGLHGMVSSGTFRASEASSLNDLAEVRQGWQAIQRVLKRLAKSEARDHLMAIAGHPVNGPHEVFVLCASTVGDDANQWRLYADGGRGYALELDSAVRLAAVSDLPPRKKPLAKPGRIDFSFAGEFALVTPWLRVIYEDRDVRKALQELIKLVEAEWASTLATAKDEEEYEFHRDRVRDESYGALASLANLIKSPGFAGENEVRVVATFFFNGDQIKYRPGANGIVGYATLTEAPKGNGDRLLRPTKTVPVKTHLPLTSVMTGPLLPDEHSNTLRGFLRRYTEDKVTVIHSSVPLRP